MENNKFNLCASLIKWLQILKLEAASSTPKELSDGVAMAQALNLIAPETFTDSWLSKVKTDVGENWRLKMSNVRKVIELIYDYYADVLNLSLTDFPRPEAQKIAEKNDEIELGRLLQLILGCAVNCLQKQDYITQIMDLEESLQRNIMTALQDLETAWQGAAASRGSMSLLNFDGKALQEEKDKMAQKCHEAERKIEFLLEEKSSMQQEIMKLQNDLEKFENPSTIGDDGTTSIGPIQMGSSRYNEHRKQLDNLKEQLLQSETVKDDYKIKSIQQEKEIMALQLKLEDLHQTSSELSQLKDEIDVLREASDKMKILESQLIIYKKKLEDHNDLKKQVKMLEDRSAEYLRQNIHFEEDAKKVTELKSQVDLFKKEIQDLHEKLDSEMSKTVKIEFEYDSVNAKLTGLLRERDNLLSERDALRETCDELRCNPGSTEAGNTMSRELSPPEFKEKIDRLEAENRALREGQGGQAALAQLLDDSNQRHEKLREQLKTANQKILALSRGQNDDSNTKGDLVVQLKQALELNDHRATLVDEGQTQVSALQMKITQLETTLVAREQELVAADVRFKKCVEKAKEVIKTLDPRAINEAAMLDKPQENSENVERPSMGPVEEKLMATAFYRLGLNCHREAVDGRLALLSGPGQSFLGRQRQPAARKPISTKK